jgi:hypothetical protein
LRILEVSWMILVGSKKEAEIVAWQIGNDLSSMFEQLSLKVLFKISDLIRFSCEAACKGHDRYLEID